MRICKQVNWTHQPSLFAICRLETFDLMLMIPLVILRYEAVRFLFEDMLSDFLNIWVEGHWTWESKSVFETPWHFDLFKYGRSFVSCESFTVFLYANVLVHEIVNVRLDLQPWKNVIKRHSFSKLLWALRECVNLRLDLQLWKKLK